MAAGAIVAGFGSLFSGFAGASAQKDAETDARRNANLARIETYNAQVADWQFNQAQQEINYKYAVASAKLSAKIQRAVATQDWETQKAISQANWIVASTNLEIENLSANAQNQRDVDFQRTLQAADYRSQMRVYEQSERTYSENTRLIADAARQGYQYEKAKLGFERQGFSIQREETFAKFENTKTQARNRAKQIEAQYKQQFREAGLTGEALQNEVKRKMQEYTGQVDSTRREASAASSNAQAQGRTGASVNRVAADPFNQANFAIGSLGVELGYFGQQKQLEMMKLASQTNLAGVLADAERQQLYDQVRIDEQLTNLGLKGLNLAERRAIFETNNALADIQLEGRSQMNQAQANRELRPMDPVKILDPLQIPKSFLPQPFEIPKPLSAKKSVNKPFLPSKPLGVPAPILGAQPFSTASAAPGILIGGITDAAASFASAFTSRPPSPTV